MEQSQRNLPSAKVAPNGAVLSSLNDLSNQNLGFRNRSLIGDDDQSVVRSWLMEFSGVETTQRAYRKEGGRFLRWVHEIQGKTLREVNRADIEAYRGFMACPPPDWCGPRRGQRGSSDWKPFERPVSEDGQRYSLIVIGSLYSYMIHGGYAEANPVALVRRKGRKRGANPEKTLSQDLVDQLLGFLEVRANTAPPESPSKTQAERELFVCTWLYETGARRGELASASLRDITSSKDQYRWQVTGKGGVHSWVPLRPRAIQAVRRYHGEQALRTRAEKPILGRLDGLTGYLDDGQVWDIVKRGCEAFAQSCDPDKLALVRKVSPHWFRHATTAHRLDSGLDLRMVQRFLRHKHISTTMLYDSTQDSAFEAALTRR